jgi:hypothetical protein
VNDPRFPDRFLPTGPDSGLAAWAREEANRLPLPVVACLDPFALRDRLAWFEHDQQRDPDEGVAAAALLLRAVLDRAVAWQAARTALHAAAERGPERGQEGGAER